MLRSRPCLVAASALSAVLVVLVPVGLAADPGTPSASLERETVPAAGRAESVVTIDGFGRFAVVATSEEGVAVQLVDRMAGPGPIHGVAGREDGRIDTFLERGETKIVIRGHPQARGEARIAVHPFREMNGDRPPRLVEARPIESTLHDLEQRSYWIHLEEDGPVILEAAGRSLADLRLWRDGRWLVEADPDVTEVQPRPGEPAGLLTLVAHVPAGLYLVTAYGGPARPWSEETEATAEHAFHLRFGFPELPATGRVHRTISPFGRDRFRLPAGARFVRVDVPEPVDVELHAARFDSRRPFHAHGARATIHKTSVMPVAEVFGPSAASGLLVTVTAEAGQPYLLQHFSPYESGAHFRPAPGSGPNRYWVSTVHAGHAIDQSDATAVLVLAAAGRGAGRRPAHAVAFAAVPVGPGQPWSRRFDLQGTTTVHLDVQRAGTYRFLADPGATVRIEPLMLTRPRHYEVPEFQPSGSRWDLDAGPHVLTVRPSETGVIHVALEIVTVAGRIWDRLVGEGDTRVRLPDPAPAQAVAQWRDVALAPRSPHAVHLAARPGVGGGLVVRRLPIDPTDPLFVAHPPGETITVPIEVGAQGVLVARAEDGTAVPIDVGGASAAESVRLSPGRHSVRIRHDGTETRFYALGFVPDRLSPRVDLPAISDALLEARPIFPVLEAGETRHLDLGRNGEASFTIRADAPALYRLESTGLLDTSGNLRTRTHPALDRSATGGTGRNFLVQRYLREGEYHLTVRTLGRSAGRLGLSLTRTPITDGGRLEDGIPARADVAAGEGVVYRFEVQEAGRHRIEALGLGRTFRIRLEDADGWPIVTPGIDGDVVVALEAGTHRLVVLPEALGGRRVVRMFRETEVPSFSGRGPHALPLDVHVRHTWHEPEDGEARVPDVWTFEMPAPAPVRVVLGPRMAGRLLRGAEVVAEVTAGAGWTGRLEVGAHRLEVKSVEPDHRLEYHLAVRPKPLLDGLSRPVSAPAELDVAAGEDGLVEISAFGRDDVRARLFDDAGVLVAEGDDRPGDWSFLVSRTLGPGNYRLRVEPVGAASAQTTVSMRRPRESVGETWTAPHRASLTPGEIVRVHPLNVTGEGLLLLAADAPETVGLALEAAAGAGPWRTVSSRVGRQIRIEVPVPIARDARYRIRLWSADRGGSAAIVEVRLVSPDPVTPAALASGVVPSSVSAAEGTVAVVAVAPDRPGLLSVEAPPPGLRWTDGMGIAAAPGSGVVARTGPGLLWLVHDLEAGASPGPLRAERVRIAPGVPVALTVPAGAAAIVDVDPRAAREGLLRRRPVIHGPVLVRVTARAGQPAATVAPAGGAAPTPGDATGISVGPSQAAAVSLSGEGRVARIWNATPAPAPLDVRVAVHPFDAPEAVDLGDGVHGGEVDAGGAVAFDLPGGERRLRLALSPSTFAVLSDGDRVRAVMGGESAHAETLVTDATRLTLLAPDVAGAFRIERLPAEAEAAPIARDRPFEVRARSAGTLRLPVAGEAGAIVRVRGAVEEVVLLGADGTIGRGDGSVPAGGGTLLVRHRPGRVLAWLDGAGETGEGLLAGDPSGRAARAASSPGIAPLSEPVEVIAVETGTGGPAMLHLRTDLPVVARIEGPDLAPRVEVHPEGLSEDLLLPRGRATVVLRPLEGDVLAGALSITTTPIVAAGEGLGDAVLLGPGSARAFSFEVSRDGPVGVGVQAEADRVDGVILDARGAVVAEAGPGFVAAMPRLAAGTYVLVLRAAADGAPVRARPALAGLEPPGTDPPEEVVRRYLTAR